jgi:hypothetical protein
VVAIVSGIAGLNATASSQSGPWPDSQVDALWPTFASIPVPESGAGGAPGWDGQLRRCAASTRVPLDYVCEYGDPTGLTGYICIVARASEAEISVSSITARVAPGDETYRAAMPSQVCDSSLAYTLSLG